MSDSHLIDGALSRAASCLGLGLMLADVVWGSTRRSVHAIGAAALLAGATWQLLLGAMEIANDLDLPVLLDVLRSTTFGRSATRTLLVSCAFVLLTALLRRRPSAAGRASAVLGAAGVAFMLALEGHAAPTGRPSQQALVHAVHVAAAATWLGGLVALADITSARGKGMPARVIGFSGRALPLVAVAVGSGIIRTADHLGSVADFLVTDYGRVLAAKVAFVAAALGVAGRHRLRSLPRIRDGVVSPGFERDLGVEIVFAVTAVLFAAGLAQLAPPR